MRAPLTIIIPTLNAAETLPQTLAILFEGLSQGLVSELIFADGGSTDATEQIAKDVGARFVPCPKGRGNQMHAAVEHATAPWMLFIHADTHLSTGWSEVMRVHMYDTSKAGYGRLQFDATGFGARFVAGWANLRSRWFKLPYGDQSLLISANLYNFIGGYPEIPLMEDVAIARKLRRDLVALDVTATTSATRYLKDGWVKRGLQNLGTLALYFMGRKPQDLVKRYHR